MNKPNSLLGELNTKPVIRAQETANDYADLIIQHLEQIGVEYVFGVPGGAIQPLYNALARSQARGGIKAVVARHESGASFMADGYTRECGVIGVCCTTTGPGATNLLTGAASAFENEIPQLIITAQTPITTFGKGAFQESSCTGINTLDMFNSCTRYNSFVSHPLQLLHKLFAATLIARRRPMGPVHLSIPVDVLAAPVQRQNIPVPIEYLALSNDLSDFDALPFLLDEIVNAQNIVLVIGMGCSGIAHDIVQLANLVEAKLVTSADGKGLISAYHPLYRGVFGFAGHSSATETLENKYVDLVLAIGTNFSEWASGGWDERALMNARLVHIDSVDKHFIYTPMAKLHVLGSIKRICEWLIAELSKHKSFSKKKQQANSRRSDDLFGSVSELYPNEWLPNCTLDEPDKYLSDVSPIKPQRLMRELGTLFPSSTRYLADTGNATAWATHYLHPLDRRMDNRRAVNRRSLLTIERRLSNDTFANASVYRACVDFASMGWAIGASVGTALANPKCPVVCITGDGSVLMNGQEITVALQHSLTVIYVVLNDSSLGMVRHGQNIANEESIGIQLPLVDFTQFAEAMGIEAYSIRSPDDFLTLDIDAICEKSGPTLLDIYIDAEEVPPIEMRVKMLKKAEKFFGRG